MRAAVVLLLVAAAMVAGPQAAQAAGAHHARPYVARVASVDGPIDLSLARTNGRHLKVRLGDVDAPAPASAASPAQCGAALAQRITSQLARPGTRVLVTAEQRVTVAGRALVGLRPLRGSGLRGPDLARSLILRGAARGDTAWSAQQVGSPPSLPVLVREESFVYPLYDAAYTSVAPARQGVGVWGACARRFHAPAAAMNPPAPAPEPWTIDDAGILLAVGPVALTATDAPTDGTRLGDLLPAFPDLEMTREHEGTCVAYSALAATQFVGVAGDGRALFAPDRRPCTAQLIAGVFSIGPIAPSRGPAPGRPEAGLRTFGIKAFTDHDSGRIPLAADITAHWVTLAQVRHGTIVGYLAERTAYDGDED